MRKVATLLLGILLLHVCRAGAELSLPACNGGRAVSRRRSERHRCAHRGGAHEPSLGQPMVIENVTGAGGTLGSSRVASARPDGYTLLAGSMGSHVSAPVLTPNLKYDPLRDFEPIGMTVDFGRDLARKDFPAKDLRGFIEYLKAHGDRVRQAHGGVGSSSHMACLLLDLCHRRETDARGLSRRRSGGH